MQIKNAFTKVNSYRTEAYHSKYQKARYVHIYSLLWTEVHRTNLVSHLYHSPSFILASIKTISLPSYNKNYLSLSSYKVIGG